MNELYLLSTMVRHVPTRTTCYTNTQRVSHFTSTHHRNGELTLIWNNNHAQLFQSNKFLLVSIKLMESLNCYIRKAFLNCILGVNLTMRSGSRFSY